MNNIERTPIGVAVAAIAENAAAIPHNPPTQISQKPLHGLGLAQTPRFVGILGIALLLRLARHQGPHRQTVMGTLWTGCAAVFVARPGQVMNPFGPQPDVRGADLGEVADKILAVELEQS